MPNSYFAMGGDKESARNAGIPTKGWGPFKIYDRKTANRIAAQQARKFGITRIDDGDRLTH